MPLSAADKRALQKLRREVERVKRVLSTQHQARVEIESLFDGVDFSETLTRARFEELNIDLFKKTLEPVKKVLADANLKKTDVDEIVLGHYNAGFTPQERTAYVGLMARYGVLATDRYVEQQREVREQAAKRGIQFFKPGKDFNDALAKFRAEDLPRLAEDFKARGVSDPDKIMKQHLAAIEKWIKIVDKTGTDRPALIKAINDEIYNKLTY